ncbi:MAG: ATP-dependent helicase, partial [Candidatus Roizmanbacteria bacterium]
GAKDNMLDPKQFRTFATSSFDEIVASIYEKYQAKLLSNNAVDFDDLMIMVVTIFKTKPHVLEKFHNEFHYFLIDEFQDTNYVQYLLSKLLAQKSRNITVVGDFSQSIYSWRGADIKNLEKFQKDFPDVAVFSLEQNYRSTQKILDYAYDVISKNSTHPILQLFTKNASGEDVDVLQLTNEEEEALHIAQQVDKIFSKELSYDSCAVLYRTNVQSRTIEEAFLHHGIPYILIGGTRFYERKEIKDLLSFVRLIVNPKDDVSQKRALKIGKKRYQQFSTALEEQEISSEAITTEEAMNFILEKTGYVDLYDENDPEDYGRLENIKELKSVAVAFPSLNDFLQQIALVESEYSNHEKENKSKGGVKLMTLHQAKGLEFDYVYIVGLEEGLLPHSRALYNKDELEEERRLFYVGVTRARKKLTITHVKRRFMFGRGIMSQPSRFIEEREEGEEYF